MSRSLLSLAILAFLGSATSYETGLQNGKTLQASRSTFKAGEHVVHYYREDELGEKTDHSMLFDGFVVKSLIDPQLAEKEKSDFVAISHHKVLKLTHEQKVHVEKKRLEEATETSSEKRKPHLSLESVESPMKLHSHLLSGHENGPSLITYKEYGHYAEFNYCGEAAGNGAPAFGIELDKCFHCENEGTGETRGCKVTYDAMLHAINYTSYESLTCEDAYWWMDMVTNTFPADQCVSHIRHDYLPWSNSYAYTTGGFSEGYYNGSSCWEAPMYYMKHKSMSTDTDTTCHSGGDGESFGVNKGCEYFYQYHNDHCSGPVYEIHPMKQIMDKCWEKDVDYGLPVMGLFDHHHGLDMDLFRIAYFCGNGQPDGSNTICMNEDGSPCHDMFQSNYEGFVGVPSSTSRICKPHDNDDELKVEFVHLVRDSSTHQGAAKITIKTPDYVSTTDRFRIVVKLFGEGQKKVIDSFKFNGRPENNTLTFQTEGHYSPPFEPREATVKVKQRVYDKERPFVRKSCVKFDLHQDDDVCPPMVHGICRAGRTLDSSACGHFDDGGERVFADGRTDEEMYSLGFSCSVTCGGIDEGHRANPDPNGGVDCVDVYNTYNDAYNCCVES